MAIIRRCLPVFLLLLAFWLAPLTPSFGAEPLRMLNVSYDPTREFYEAYDKLFAAHWKEQTGEDITIQQSHGGSASRRAPSSTGCRPMW